MTTQDNIVKDNPTPAQRLKHDWEAISYKLIISNVPYILFLSVLCLGYISNSHRAVMVERDIIREEAKLSTLRNKHTLSQSGLIQARDVRARAEQLGLTPSKMPAYKIPADK
jgi:hypothetical protein